MTQGDVTDKTLLWFTVMPHDVQYNKMGNVMRDAMRDATRATLCATQHVQWRATRQGQAMTCPSQYSQFSKRGKANFFPQQTILTNK